jgi:hypothetical protein
MREERGHRVREHAPLEQVDLPAAPFLRRRADQLDPDLEIPRRGGRGEERADDRHRDEVVTAAMPDVRKGVVLGEQGHRRSRRTHARAERGRKTAQVPLDRVTVLFQKRRDATDGAMLVVGELGIGVDLARQADEVVAEPLRDHL